MCPIITIVFVTVVCVLSLLQCLTISVCAIFTIVFVTIMFVPSLQLCVFHRYDSVSHYYHSVHYHSVCLIVTIELVCVLSLPQCLSHCYDNVCPIITIVYVTMVCYSSVFSIVMIVFIITIVFFTVVCIPSLLQCVYHRYHSVRYHTVVTVVCVSSLAQHYNRVYPIFPAVCVPSLPQFVSSLPLQQYVFHLQHSLFPIVTILFLTIEFATCLPSCLFQKENSVSHH